MAQKKNGNEVALRSDELGSEKKIHAVLTDWGIDKAAIQRMLDEHQARQANARAHALRETNATLDITVNHAPAISYSLPSR